MPSLKAFNFLDYEKRNLIEAKQSALIAESVSFNSYSAESTCELLNLLDGINNE